MKLNLGGMQKPAAQPSLGLGLNLNAIQNKEESESDSKADRTPPSMQPIKNIPSLKLGDVSSTPDPQPSNESAGKPKMSFGLGLDLTKAK